MKSMLVILFSGFISMDIAAENIDQHKVDSCQYIVDQLENIKDLKRKSGSSQHKNSLRKQRQSLDKKYGQLHCYTIKEHLKR